MKKHIQIRNAQLSDINAMATLLAELFAIETDFTINKERQHQGLFLMLRNRKEHTCVKVAEVNKKVVGMCAAQLLISTAEGGSVAMIEDLIVAKPYRKMGLGRMLMDSIESWALDHGATRLQLLADRTNFGALDFYDHIGWLPTRLICLRRKPIITSRKNNARLKR